jgi:hypothetical protein
VAQDELRRIRELWQQQLEAPYPVESRGQLEDIDLTLLDAEAAGCISTFLGNRGRLDSDRLRILEQLVGDLDHLVPQLAGASAEHFTQLARVVTATVQFCARFPRHP